MATVMMMLMIITTIIIMTTTTTAGMTKTVIHPRTQTEGGGGNALDAIALYVNVCECV